MRIRWFMLVLWFGSIALTAEADVAQSYEILCGRGGVGFGKNACIGLDSYQYLRTPRCRSKTCLTT